MPTAHCKHPQHRGPYAWPPFAWIATLGLGALIITHWHTVELVLVVLGILAALGVPVMLLVHNHRPFYDPQLEHDSAAMRALERRTVPSSVTVAQTPAVAAADGRDALSAAPVVHRHIHFHGVDVDDMATVARKAIEHPSPPEGGARWNY